MIDLKTKLELDCQSFDNAAIASGRVQCAADLLYVIQLSRVV